MTFKALRPLIMHLQGRRRELADVEVKGARGALSFCEPHWGWSAVVGAE
jgi:hypothetical protein